MYEILLYKICIGVYSVVTTAFCSILHYLLKKKSFLVKERLKMYYDIFKSNNYVLFPNNS